MEVIMSFGVCLRPEISLTTLFVPAKGKTNVVTASRDSDKLSKKYRVSQI